MNGEEKEKVLFVLSVDTEEEWDWSSSFPQTGLQTENIQAISSFQSMCDDLGVRPTYFVDFPVAANPSSALILKQVLASGRCEIGAHLHPWCNPPLTEENGEFESHVVNLPLALVEEKMVNLLNTLRTTFDTDIVSFRTGRWGINHEVLNLLIEHGIDVDSSVYPFYRNHFFHCDGAPVEPYWPSLTDPLKVDSTGQSKIYELPVSAGFNYRNFERCESIYKVLSKPVFSHLKFLGVAWELNLLRKLYLSPELTSLENMKTLVDQLLARKSPVIHMNLHSSSLVKLAYNNHGFDPVQIRDNMTQLIKYLVSKVDVEFCTISEAKQRLTVTKADK